MTAPLIALTVFFIVITVEVVLLIEGGVIATMLFLGRPVVHIVCPAWLIQL